MRRLHHPRRAEHTPRRPLTGIRAFAALSTALLGAAMFGLLLLTPSAHAEIPGAYNWASSSAVGWPASLAVDGSQATRWRAAVDTLPQRWTINLGGAREVGAVVVDFYKENDRYYDYHIFARPADSLSWDELSSGTAQGRVVARAYRSYEFIRVRFDGTTFGRASLTEVHVYAPEELPQIGIGTNPEVTPTPEPTVVPTVAPTPTVDPTPSVDPTAAPTPVATPTIQPTPGPVPTPTVLPTTQPTATPVPVPTPTIVPTQQPTVVPTPQPTPTTQSAGEVVRVSGTSASAIDSAVSAAIAKGVGATVYFPVGSYSHAEMTWPNGINLRGDGIGRTQLNFAMRFGSNSLISSATLGSSTSGTPFRFVNGAHHTTLADVRLRSYNTFSLLGATDYTGGWNNAVINSAANFHDIVFQRVEFEYTGNPNSDLVSIWTDSRAGGGNVYNVSWIDCTFGVKNARGQFGQGRVGLIIQPSPPEHAADGPRPPTATDPGGINSTNFSFDWNRVTHGLGQAAIGGSTGYGFRMTGTRFVGPASFVSMNPCDYSRAWAMVTFRLTNPGSVTQAMRDAAPDKVTSKGWYVANNWFSRDLRFENGRNVTLIGNTESGGTSSYNVSAAVLQHDRELYGF